MKKVGGLFDLHIPSGSLRLGVVVWRSVNGKMRREFLRIDLLQEPGQGQLGTLWGRNRLSNAIPLRFWIRARRKVLGEVDSGLAALDGGALCDVRSGIDREFPGSFDLVMEDIETSHHPFFLLGRFFLVGCK